MNRNKYVFVSYSREDRSFVDRLVHDLQSSGINTWHDVAQISPGENWQKAIEGGIRRASVLLYVSSKHSGSSEWMERELRACHQKSATVIPIVIDDEGARNIADHPLMSGLQFVDLRLDYETAVEPLKRTLMIAVGHSPPLRSEAPKSKGYVFLSYAEEDASFMSDLRDFLKGQGYAYWDYAESDRDYHAQLFLELEGVIRDATATLSVLSPDWKRSQWAIKEYLFSEEVNTPVFLLKAREPGPTLVIAGMPFIDFTESGTIGLEALANELQRKGL